MTDMYWSNHSSGHDGVEVPRSARSLPAMWRNIAQPSSAGWKAEQWTVTNIACAVTARKLCHHENLASVGWLGTARAKATRTAQGSATVLHDQ
jgi:hypothetical protein